MSDRCTGHCCKAFTLPYSPDELQEKFEEWVGGKDNGPRDIDVVWPMAIYLGPSHVNPATGLQHPETFHVYTCEHFEGGNCTIYEGRPNVCRRYPNGRKCYYKDCTWDAAREGRIDWDGNLELPNELVQLEAQVGRQEKMRSKT